MNTGTGKPTPDGGVMNTNIYLSLDEARSELARRWQDATLKPAIRQELGDFFMPHYDARPLAISFRQLVSADNGLAFFYQCARYIGAEPVVQEFLGDLFVHFNEEKKGLGRLRVTLEDGAKAMVEIMDFHANERKPLHDCQIKTGESLVAFHHALLSMDGYNLKIFDETDWFKSLGRASNYYYFFLLHSVAHGALFEYFFDEGGTNEDKFTHEVVYPAIERIKEKFGLAPMIVRAFPEHQTDEEDFYWWSHSPRVNAYLIDYARKHNLPFKPVKKGRSG